MEGLRLRRALRWASGALAALTLMAGALLATASQPASAATSYQVIHVVSPGPPAIDMWIKCKVIDGVATDCKPIPPPPPSDTLWALTGGGASSGGPLGPIAWLLLAASAALVARIVTTRRKRAPQLVVPASQTA